MRSGPRSVYRFTALTGVVVALIGLILLLSRTVDAVHPIGAFLALLGAVLVVASLVRLRRLQS